jgi:transcriptional regulator with XRE-family HTH domain
MDNIWSDYNDESARARRSELKSQMVAKKIAEALTRKQISKGFFASIMGIQPSIISRWLSGKHNFTIETLFDIEEALQIKLLDIDEPEDNSMSFRIKVNSDHASFDHKKMFPDFTSIIYSEDQKANPNENSEDLSAYLEHLNNELNKRNR